MNKLLLPRPKRLLKRSKEELRNWKKNLKLKDKLGPKLNAKGQTWQENLKAWEKDWERLEVPLMLRLNKTRVVLIMKSKM